MHISAFHQTLDDPLAIFVALEAHLEGDLLGVEVRIFFALTRWVIRVLFVKLKGAPVARRSLLAVSIVLCIGATLLLLIELLQLGAKRLLSLILDEVLV